MNGDEFFTKKNKIILINYTTILAFFYLLTLLSQFFPVIINLILSILSMLFMVRGIIASNHILLRNGLILSSINLAFEILEQASYYKFDIFDMVESTIIANTILIVFNFFILRRILNLKQVPKNSEPVDLFEFTKTVLIVITIALVAFMIIYIMLMIALG